MKALAEAGYEGLPQKRLAELFGVSPQAVRKWLHAEAIPKSSRAPGIAKILGVRRVWLLDGELPVRMGDLSEKSQKYDTHDDTVLTLSSEEIRLLSHYRRLPKGLQATFKAFLTEVGTQLGSRKK